MENSDQYQTPKKKNTGGRPRKHKTSAERKAARAATVRKQSEKQRQKRAEAKVKAEQERAAEAEAEAEAERKVLERKEKKRILNQRRYTKNKDPPVAPPHEAGGRQPQATPVLTGVTSTASSLKSASSSATSQQDYAAMHQELVQNFQGLSTRSQVLEQQVQDITTRMVIVEDALKAAQEEVEKLKYVPLIEAYAKALKDESFKLAASLQVNLLNELDYVPRNEDEYKFISVHVLRLSKDFVDVATELSQRINQETDKRTKKFDGALLFKGDDNKHRVLVVELKHNETAKKGFAQILDRKYKERAETYFQSQGYAIEQCSGVAFNLCTKGEMLDITYHHEG